MCIRPPTAHRSWAHQFVHGQLAIPILVERFESSRRVGDLIFINYAVVVGIQSGDDRGRPVSAGSRAGLSVWGLAPGIRGGAVILGDDEGCGRSQGEERQGCFGQYFHMFPLVELSCEPASQSHRERRGEGTGYRQYLMFTAPS